MKTGTLAHILNQHGSARVYITHEGERFNPGKVSELMGPPSEDPKDAIIEANGLDPVTADAMVAVLIQQDANGDAQIYVRASDDDWAYYDVGHVMPAHPSGNVHIQVGEFRCD